MVCYVCEKETKPRAAYCLRCRKFIYHKPDHAARAAALKEAWDPVLDGFRCLYTGIKLDESNPGSRRYLTFDHPVPGDSSRLVACCRLVNEMKSDMTSEEFFAFIRAFAVYRRTGVFPKDAVDLGHWMRTVKPSRQGAAPLPPGKGTAVVACGICGKPSVPGSTYCPRCRKFVHGKYERRARRVALKRAWSPELDGFVCENTGVRLDENNPKDPWYVSVDHRFPGKKGHLAVCARVVNTVKATLTAEQFPKVMEALARHLEGEPFDESVLDG